MLYVNNVNLSSIKRLAGFLATVLVIDLMGMNLRPSCIVVGDAMLKGECLDGAVPVTCKRIMNERHKDSRNKTEILVKVSECNLLVEFTCRLLANVINFYLREDQNMSECCECCEIANARLHVYGMDVEAHK